MGILMIQVSVIASYVLMGLAYWAWCEIYN